MDDVSAEFKAWVMKRKPSETFDYISNDDCVYARFLKDTGRSEKPNVSESFWFNDRDETPTVIPITIRQWLDVLIKRTGGNGCTMGQMQQIVSA